MSATEQGGGGPNQWPHRSFRAGSDVGPHTGLLLRICAVLPPAAGGVVVVRSGVYNGGGDVTMRQVSVRCSTANANCRTAHAGKPKRFRSAVATTSGVIAPRSSATSGKSAQDLLEPRRKSANARPLLPVPGLAVWVRGRNGPVCREAAKVVEPEDVDRWTCARCMRATHQAKAPRLEARPSGRGDYPNAVRSR